MDRNATPAVRSRATVAAMSWHANAMWCTPEHGPVEQQVRAEPIGRQAQGEVIHLQQARLGCIAAVRRDQLKIHLEESPGRAGSSHEVDETAVNRSDGRNRQLVGPDPPFK